MAREPAVLGLELAERAADPPRDRGSKLTRKGGKVTARLKLRYDAALAGRRLQADVVAADIHGTKQVERDAATIKVAR